jgi:hypothetical protein
MPDRTILDTWNPVTRRSTELVIDGETGATFVVHTQDTKPIIEANKRASNNFDPYAPNPHGMTRVASIPMVIWRQWQALGITKDERLLNAELDKPENRFLRTDGGRRLI